MKFKMDPMGQYTAATTDEQNPSSFFITAHLKEAVDPATLQHAVNDVMTRLPFLSGRMRPGFFWWSQELIPPPKIISASVPHRFEYYYGKGACHTLRVLYGERHFTVENIHSNVDGRGLLKATQTLLARYFELRGVAFDKTGMIDCEAELHPEEAESGYARFYDPKKKAPKQIATSRPKAFQTEPNPGTPTRIVSQNFDLPKLKAAAKQHGCTISEYMLAHMFLALAEQRSAYGCTLPIAAMLPVDFRSFFPTRTVRNFVGAATINMPETNDFVEMISGLHTQFATIDQCFAQGGINEMQGLINLSGWVPFALKKLVMRLVKRHEGRGLTTVFSNLGKVKLPPEIEQQLENLEFVIDLEATDTCFSCVTAGDVLTLTVSVSSNEAEQLAKTVMNRLEG